MVSIIRGALTGFLDDDAFILAAALAFHSTLSLAPIAVVVVFVASLLGTGTQETAVDQIRFLMGPSAGGAVQSVIENAEQDTQLNSIHAFFGLGMALVAATTAFVQLQFCMNRIWNIEVTSRGRVWNWLRKRMLSLLLLLVIGLLLIASLVLSAILTSFLPAWEWLNALLSLLICTALFAWIFRVLPDAEISWSVVWFGAAITAALFVFGRLVIGLYLSRADLNSSYGAASSIVVLLVWIYYASLVFFLGAEITQVYACERGRRIVPSIHASWRNRSCKRASQLDRDSIPPVTQ